MNVDEAIERNPFKATAKEKSICRLNRATCCSHKDIMSLQETFLNAEDEFKKKMDIFENVMVLFQGGKYIDFLIGLKEEGNEQCYNELVNNFGNKDFPDILKIIKE